MASVRFPRLLSIQFDPRIFLSLVLGLTHTIYLSPVTRPPCVSSHIEPSQRSSTFLLSTSSTLRLSVPFFLFVAMLSLALTFSFAPLVPCLLRSYSRYCDIAALFNDWIVELIMNLSFVCYDHFGCSRFSLCSCS